LLGKKNYITVKPISSCHSLAFIHTTVPTTATIETK